VEYKPNRETVLRVLPTYNRDAMLPRFLADSIDVDAGIARLSADEARHLAQVLRLEVDDDVAVFDGAGREFRARVDSVAKDGAELRLLEEFPAAPEPAVRLTLAQAVIKGEKMDDVVRDATMMGVAAIEPLVTEHTAAHMKEGRAPERWRRIAIASAKQCRRAVVPAIGPGLPFQEWLSRDVAETRILLVEPSAAVEGHPLSTLGGARPATASVLVGPEGGWSVLEIEAAVRAGCIPITLGRRTLRADAVPTVAIGVLQFLWGDL
jgi:16S rRNA (uracil1498-N3)-methyltransferase